MDERMSIGTVAARSGVKVPTVRYYESIGLLEAPPRTASNRRSYDADDLRRLVFIRHARDLGFEVEAIRRLIGLAATPGQSCSAVDAVARDHLRDVEERIARLEALRGELVRMLESCAHGTVAECRIMEVIGDHAHCAAPRH